MNSSNQTAVAIPSLL